MTETPPTLTAAIPWNRFCCPKIVGEEITKPFFPLKETTSYANYNNEQ